VNQDVLNLVRSAALWPEAEIVRYAREWLRASGSEFLRLPPSQAEAFWQSVCDAETVQQFDEALTKFFTGVEKRGKRNTPWARATGKTLTQSLTEALANVSEEVTRDPADRQNEAFARACEILGDHCPSRDLPIRKAFLRTLLQMHGCQKEYPFQEEEL
jgi:hypothetical protein